MAQREAVARSRVAPTQLPVVEGGAQGPAEGVLTLDVGGGQGEWHSWCLLSDLHKQDVHGQDAEAHVWVSYGVEQ